MKFNPTNLDYQLIQKKALAAKESESYRKPVPGLNNTYSEQNFIKFQVLSGSNPINLFTYRESPTDTLKPKAIVFLIHGLFNHQNRMSHLGKFFAKFGIVTLGYDFRGHGKSEDIPGYIDNYQTLINDFIAFTKLIDEIYPKDIPRFTISQSLGGMVSFLVSIKLPDYFRGMIFLAPCLQMNEKLNFLLKIVKFFNYITPKVEFNCFARKNDSSKNPAVFESIFQDKGIYLGGIKPRAIASISYGTEEVRRNLNNFNTPYLMVVGEFDTLVDMRTNIELSKHSKNKDNTVLWVDNCWHDIAHEEEIWDVLEVARKWIEERI